MQSAWHCVGELLFFGTLTAQKTCRRSRRKTQDARLEASMSEGLTSMCKFEQYRAEATKYKERADTALTVSERQAFQDLERTFSTLADNEQWLSNNHDKTLHAPKRFSISASSFGPIPDTGNEI
jgi:hypothetical protein